jgi:hypothetical protein
MTSNHVRNTGPMLASQRCGAKTRSGKACMSPAVSRKSRCRMHGGARDRERLEATGTPSSMVDLPAKLTQNAAWCGRCCRKRAR